MKIIIKVGMPKNFDAGDGTNTFECTVDEATFGSRVVERDSRPAKFVPELKGKKSLETFTEYWFAVDCRPIEVEGVKFSSLLLTSRYKLNEVPFDMLKRGESLVMHAAWKADGTRWDKPSIDSAIKGEVEMGGMFVVNATFPTEDIDEPKGFKIRREDLY
jgi:hypothetical protein